MSRKRMLSPDIWTDEGFLELDPLARLLFIGLISHADDEGRGHAMAKALKAKVFPGDDLDEGSVAALCGKLSENMRVQFYEVAGTRYYQLEKWQNHQSINRPSPSTIPGPDGTPAPLNERSVSAHLEIEEVKKERKEEKESAKRTYAPLVKMTDEEHEKLVAKHGEEVVNQAVELLDAYKLEKGKTYKSDAGALRSWAIQAALERRDKGRGRGGVAPPGVVKFAGRVCAKCGETNTHSGSMCMGCNEELPRRKA